jgi:predicted alpha-1,2-mannosidase
MNCLIKYFAIALFITTNAGAQSLVKYVDPLIGTAPAATISAKRNSTAGSEEKGQTFPGVGRPFGMTQWTPETRTTETKCISPYYYNDTHITGFRGSHWMSGSCTQDYGSFTIMPFTTEFPDTVTVSPVSSFSHSNEVSTPSYYSVLLNDFGIEAELTGASRSGIMRFTFSGNKYNCLYIRANSDPGKGEVRQLKNLIIGCNPVRRIYQGRGESAGFSGWFVILFDKEYNILPGKSGKQKMILSFGDEETVTAYIGTSFTSFDEALKNLATEIPSPNFEEVRKSAVEEWENALGKIEVKGGSDNDKIKFYSALYHCFQLPRIASDCDGSYQGFAQDTLIHTASGFDYYDDFSMWDTFRGLHPLMTIIEPVKSLHMVKSLVLKAQQGGWMPIFPAWGSYTAAMIGDHVSTMIADAYIKGIDDFDIKTAYKFMRKNAFDSPSRQDYLDGKGRRALQSYMKYGYIPLEDSVWDAFHRREQVSRTLEYAMDDYALAQVARKTGNRKDYRLLMYRSMNYKNVFDTASGYVRGRYSDGSWIRPFSPNSRAPYICEGTPFQYTWYVPQDVKGLISLMGGKERYLDKLNEFFDKGYYWHGNETDQQAPFMFAMAGFPEKTRYWSEKINNDEYGTGPGGLSGNEDAGQMSAWLVFSMMGFYPACPATGEYVTTLPAFDQVTINLTDGKKFTIKVLGRKPGDYSPVSVSLNKQALKRNFLKHSEISQGGELVYTFRK